MRGGFALIELIVVIIIVGILAAVGISQYSKTVEKGRTAEAITNFGAMRTLANTYYMENGTFSTISNADLGIGSGVPGSCDSLHYFSYGFTPLSSTCLGLTANRCLAGGKSPQGSWTVRGTLWFVIDPTGPPCQAEKQTCLWGGSCVTKWDIQ